MANLFLSLITESMIMSSVSSVSSEDIFKCLCCLTAFKGVLDAPSDSEIVLPRPDLTEKYGNLDKGLL